MASRFFLLLVLCLFGVEQVVCQTMKADESPPEVTLLKHGRSFERRFGAIKHDSQGTEDAPMPHTRMTSFIVISAKVKNNTTKTITGVTWYFVLNKSSVEEYFRIRFTSLTEIAGEKTKTLKGTLERWPTGPRRAVGVEELKAGSPPPPKERILISCLLFSDGTFSSLKDSPTADCHDLVLAEKVAK